MEERIKELEKAVEKLDADRKAVILPLLPTIAFYEEQIRDCRSKPQLIVNPKDPTLQKITPAAKQLAKIVPIYLNTVKTVLTALYKIENDAADELLTKLKEFDLEQ